MAQSVLFIGPTLIFWERTIIWGFFEHILQALHRITKNSNFTLMALQIHQMCLSEFEWN